MPRIYFNYRYVFYKTLGVSDLPKSWLRPKLEFFIVICFVCCQCVGRIARLLSNIGIIEGLFVTYINQPWLLRLLLFIFLICWNIYGCNSCDDIICSVILPIANNYGVSPIAGGITVITLIYSVTPHMACAC